MSCYSLTCKIFPEKSANHLMGFPLNATNCFFLMFYNFHYNVSWWGSLCIHLIWKFLGSLGLDICFLPHSREHFRYYFFKQLFWPLFSLFIPGPYNTNVILPDVVPGPSMCFQLFILLLWLSGSFWVCIITLSSVLLIHPSILTDYSSYFIHSALYTL